MGAEAKLRKLQLISKILTEFITRKVKSFNQTWKNGKNFRGLGDHHWVPIEQGDGGNPQDSKLFAKI